MVLLIENQESTQDLIIEILCHLTTITQKGFGLRCYDILSYLAKKSKILRRKVMFLMKDICLTNFYKNDLSLIEDLYLESFLNVIEDNNMGEIIGAEAYVYIQIWMKHFIQNGFRPPDANAQKIKQIFRLLGILAANPDVPFTETIMSILATNMFCEARKLKSKIETEFYIMVEYICFALTKYCERNLPKLNVANFLYADKHFMQELIKEINVDTLDNLRIYVKKSQVTM